MNGHEYKRLIAQYVVKEYGHRLRVYDEVNIGTSIIGKQRRVDLLLVEPSTNKALALECKYQDSSGTADEKIPYTLQDLATLRMPAAVVYAGTGFSEGVLHMLQSSEYAAYCQPTSELGKLARQKGQINSGTWQLDHILAVTFQWWELLIGDKVAVSFVDRNAQEAPVPEEATPGVPGSLPALPPAQEGPALAEAQPARVESIGKEASPLAVECSLGFETQLSLGQTKAKVPFDLSD
ncbi:MAG: PD-(D/E)XK nuclease superfamily protein [Polyangiaceae bacterium]|nr:PD-(D/E)XK nuclease superfamily protein [Polyangiaceae bacterium]